MSVIDRFKQRGKVNMTIANYQLELDNLSKQLEVYPEGYYPNDGVPEGPLPAAVELGKWDFYPDYDYFSGVANGQIMTGEGETADSITGLVFAKIDKNSNDISSVINDYLYPLHVTLEWREGGVLTHTMGLVSLEYDQYNGEYIIYFDDPATNYTYDFGTLPVNGTEITLTIQPPPTPEVPPSPGKSWVHEFSFSDRIFPAPGGLTGSENGINIDIPTLNIVGKDKAYSTKVDFEMTTAGITYDEYTQFMLYFFQRPTPTTESGAFIVPLPFETVSANSGKTVIKGSTIIPIRMNDWDAIKYLIIGMAWSDDISIKLRFTHIG